MLEELNAVETYEKHNKKRKIKDINEKMTDCSDQHKTKMVIDFNGLESASIKSFAVKKKKNEIKVTSRFISGKLLMFAKLSFKSFLYDLTETFCFPSQLALEIHKKYKIERVEMWHVLTDTDSTAIQFIVISDPNSDVPEPKFRDIIFEIVAAVKIYKQFDSSHEGQF